MLVAGDGPTTTTPADDDEHAANNRLREPLLQDHPQERHDERNNNASPDQEARPTSDDDNGDDDDIANPWKNHNVLLSLVFCVVCGTADSIWGSVVLSGFLLALSQAMGDRAEGNTLVGSATAVQGLVQLLTALPIGHLADTWGKAKTVRLGGGLMLITIVIHLWTLVDVEQHAERSAVAATRSYVLMTVVLALWGIVQGISNGPSQALFADSIPTGRRSEMLTWLYTCYLLSSAIGPIVSIILVTTERDAEDWSISELFPVFFVGVALEIPAAILMFFFSDKHVVPESTEEEDGDDVSPTSSPESEDEQPPEVTENETENLLNNDSDGTPSEPTEACANGIPATELSVTSGEPPSSRMHTRHHRMKKAIPYVLFASSLITSLASGASVKYFPLFFKEVGFGSAAVQGIFLLVPIFISSFSFIAQRMGKRLGRIETTFITGVFGVSLLYFMTWLSRDVGGSSDGGSDASLWVRAPHRALFIVAVYLVRTGAMNCSYPLLESILMDNVPSNQRSRWKALESIAAFGWTGSALVGGILSDEHSYQFTFSITATMQLCGGLLLLLIQPFVEAEVGP